MEGRRCQAPLEERESRVAMEDSVTGELPFSEKLINRGEIMKHLSNTKFLDPREPAFFHGRIYMTCPPAPQVG